MPLHRPHGQCRMHAPQSVVYGAVTCDHAALREARYEYFRILEIRIVPSGAIQPERSAGRSWQDHVLSIEQVRHGQLWHEGAQPEADSEPLAFRRTVDRRCFGLRAAHGHRGLTLVARDDHLPMTGCD